MHPGVIKLSKKSELGKSSKQWLQCLPEDFRLLLPQVSKNSIFASIVSEICQTQPVLLVPGPGFEFDVPGVYLQVRELSQGVSLVLTSVRFSEVVYQKLLPGPKSSQIREFYQKIGPILFFSCTSKLNLWGFVYFPFAYKEENEVVNGLLRKQLIHGKILCFYLMSDGSGYYLNNGRVLYIRPWDEPEVSVVTNSFSEFVCAYWNLIKQGRWFEIDSPLEIQSSLRGQF